MIQPLVVEMSSGPDPWEAFVRLAPLPHVLFLDSALVNPTLGRYSYLTADPFAWLTAPGSRTNELLAQITDTLDRYQTETLPDLPPFQGGVAGLFSYDLCHAFERLPTSPIDEFQIPDIALGVYDWVLAFDQLLGKAWLFSSGFPEVDEPRRLDRAIRRIDKIRRLLLASQPATSSPKKAIAGAQAHAVSPRTHQYPVSSKQGITSCFDRPGYLNVIARAIDYIHAGDCYQVNLAQRLLAAAPEDPLALYGRLRQCNPAPFAGYFDLGDFVVASASPERFLRLEKDVVETRPIKGTRSRGATPQEDASLKDELLGSAKDRAENVMIVDLMRNDLGRVCQFGSVHVSSLCRMESYQTVHHLVSEICGKLRLGLGPVDLLKAAFPGGSVTGAPKIRAMEIIAELEPAVRGAYCGSMGYLGFNGSMDTSILIRTFTLGRGWAQFPVGGGIVADSVPEREYEETWDKAEGLLRAL
jgi:para-aminobenzoate synthetase component I